MSSASFPPVPRCYEGPGQDVRPSLSGARSQDTRSAAFRCRSIVLAYSASDYQTAPSLAHAVTRRDPRARPITFCCTILRVQHRKYSPTQLTLYPTLFASVPLNPISCFAAYRSLRFAASPANRPVSIPCPSQFHNAPSNIISISKFFSSRHKDTPILSVFQIILSVPLDFIG